MREVANIGNIWEWRDYCDITGIDDERASALKTFGGEYSVATFLVRIEYGAPRNLTEFYKELLLVQVESWSDKYYWSSFSVAVLRVYPVNTACKLCLYTRNSTLCRASTLFSKCYNNYTWGKTTSSQLMRRFCFGSQVVLWGNYNKQTHNMEC